MSASSGLRIAVDVGSTFTDVVLHDGDSGELRVAKRVTTPEAPERGVLEALAEVVRPGDLERACLFLHATTVGLNALLERSGPTLGLLTTDGFRDVLDIRRGVRRDQRGERVYDLLWKAPPALVPRALRRTVRERTGADGAIVTPVDAKDVQAAADVFRAESVHCVAITFFNAHANPQNERRAAALLRDAGFSGEISLSCELSREIYEYERASTTAVDAYVRPRITRYLSQLQAQLEARGFQGQCLITRSGGGAATFEDARKRPFEVILSGPVAGAVCAGRLASEHGADRAIAADVGGTSFDTCLLIDGRPSQLHEGEILGMPVQAPWIDVRSIGAGGGTIARIEGGLLRMGPHSAGAVPGPVCYRRGGDLPTLTDAAAALGMLGDGRLAAGVQLELELARRAVRELGRPLGLQTSETARGILQVSVAAMAAAIRSVTIQIGEDPRRMALVPYGGAGPLLACLLMAELGAPRALVPNHAGNFSACGLLVQEPMRGSARTLLRPLSGESLAEAEKLAAELLAELRSDVRDSARDVASLALDLRYLGQAQSLSIDAPGGERLDVAEMRARFEALYARRFGYTLDGPLELVAVRTTLRTPQPPVAFARACTSPEEATPGEHSAFSFARGRRLAFQLLERESLAPGRKLEGPAIVREPTATLYLDAGFRAEVLADHTLCITQERA